MANQDAAMAVKAVLSKYGLESLTDWAMDALVRGLSEAEIVQEMRNRPEFDQRFPGIKQREAAGLNAISPGEYVEYETRASQLAKFYGMPFTLGRQQVAALISGDVSPTELEARIQGGYNRVASAPAEVRDWFSQMYGTKGDQALAAFFVDPDLSAPELERFAAAAEAGGYATMAGFGLGRDQAETVARLGLSRDQVAQGMAGVGQQAGLFDETITESVDLQAGREGVDAQFGSSDQARQAVQRRADQRAAAFAGSNETTATQQGVIGLGTSKG